MENVDLWPMWLGAVLAVAALGLATCSLVVSLTRSDAARVSKLERDTLTHRHAIDQAVGTMVTTIQAEQQGHRAQLDTLVREHETQLRSLVEEAKEHYERAETLRRRVSGRLGGERTAQLQNGAVETEETVPMTRHEALNQVRARFEGRHA